MTTSVGVYEFNPKDLIGHGAFAVVYKGRVKSVSTHKHQCCGYEMFIPDPDLKFFHPGSRMSSPDPDLNFSIQDPGTKNIPDPESASKNCSI